MRHLQLNILGMEFEELLSLVSSIDCAYTFNNATGGEVNPLTYLMLILMQCPDRFPHMYIATNASILSFLEHFPSYKITLIINPF